MVSDESPRRSVTSIPAKRNNTNPSCAVCQRRKVKCNRTHPCAACTKSGFECHFPSPSRSKRRKIYTQSQSDRSKRIASAEPTTDFPVRKPLENLGGASGRLDTSSEDTDFVEKVQSVMHDEILQYCDPKVPLQLFTIYTGKTFLNTLRLIAQTPKSASSSRGIHQIYSPEAFYVSRDTMKLQLSLWSEPSLRRWNLSRHYQFPWHVFACLVLQTRLHPLLRESLKAWTIICRVFDTIIPTLECGAERKSILSAMKGLLNAAANDKPTWTFGGPALTIKASCSPSYCETTSTRLTREGYARFFGSQPHSALLPGMAIEPESVRGSAGTAIVNNNLVPAFDYESVDWAQFDRLALELYETTGSSRQV